MQHAGRGLKGNHSFRYHLHVFPKDVGLEIAFAYGTSVELEVQNNHEDLLGDLDTLNMYDEKEGVDGRISRNTVTAQIIEKWDENSAMDIWFDYMTDVPI